MRVSSAARIDGAMNTHRIPHGTALDRYLQDLQQCPPMSAAEERMTALRMRRLKVRLLALLGGLPKAPRLRLTGPGAGAADLPFARYEEGVRELERSATSARGPRLRTRARRARALLEKL